MTFAARPLVGGKVGEADLSAIGLLGFGSGTPVTIGLRVDADGWIYSQEPPAPYTQEYQWLVAGNASDFEFKMDYVGGTDWFTKPFPNGEWGQISEDRTWERVVTTGQNLSGSFTLSVRDRFSLEQHDSVSVTWSCSNS